MVVRGANPDEKKLVFIHHRESLAHVAELLEAARIPFARFAGDLSGPDKDAAADAFRDRVPVLPCTESGGEGRNLQFCNTLINFDIPWNPMAIEQRIGRIDRIGREREVFIFNLATAGTLEDSVLRILDDKINMFELLVGEVGAILGELEEERDFAELVLDAWLATTEAAAGKAAEGFDALGDRGAARRRAGRVVGSFGRRSRLADVDARGAARGSATLAGGAGGWRRARRPAAAPVRPAGALFARPAPAARSRPGPAARVPPGPAPGSVPAPRHRPRRRGTPAGGGTPGSHRPRIRRQAG